MTARGKMTMRAVHQQDQQAGPDGYNRKDPPDWQILDAALPCWLYTRRAQRTIDGVKTVTVEEMRAMIPLATVVAAGERLNSVSDQAGAVIHSTPMKIEGVLRRSTHLELVLVDASQ